MVAHRLSTVARTDKLIVLDRGRIIEQGTHADLLDLGGTCARLWQHQSGGFPNEEAVPTMLATAVCGNAPGLRRDG